uniref:Uncharacterized protein n=1 Tax=Tanacetum cinerariifolium TaxID=118510 RepID=A0A699H6Q0_TANCI|nr:hypothetical protein [Tanacetum cinerariifolium]
MGDENPIRTLGDYSRPSHKGYRNTTELPNGNNVVPLRSDTIQLVQKGCSFHGLWTYSGKSLTMELISGSKCKYFYDRIDRTLTRTVDYAAEGRLRKLSVEKAWNTIEELVRYNKEGCYDPIFLEEGSINYKTPNIEQLLRVMKCQVDTLMKDAISLMGKSRDLYRLTSNTMPQLPLELSHQEQFEGLVMNFILD